MDNVRTGKLISEIRKKKGFTQQQLADALGVTVDELLRREARGYEEIAVCAIMHPSNERRVYDANAEKL